MNKHEFKDISDDTNKRIKCMRCGMLAWMSYEDIPLVYKTVLQMVDEPKIYRNIEVIKHGDPQIADMPLLIKFLRNDRIYGINAAGVVFCWVVCKYSTDEWEIIREII